MKGFTLVEILTVVAVISILAYLSVPAFSSLAGAQAVDEGIYQVSAILQQARSEAVARQTYVWVGFSQSTRDGGLPELTILATASKDGSTSSAPANLMNLGRPIRVDGIVMTPWSGLKTTTSALFAGGPPVSVGGAGTTGVLFPTQATIWTHTLTFTPRGEAMQALTPGPDDPYDAFLDVSFRQANNAVPVATANDASVIVDGATGTVRTVRLQ